MKTSNQLNNYIFALSFLLTTWSCARIQAAEQILKTPVWATCKADLAKGYPERAYLAKPILVKVIGINLKTETLMVEYDAKRVYKRSLHDCNPLIDLTKQLNEVN